ncbi:MAG TPA: pyridoxal phosphate-dependent aminotransferase [Bryobacterales bacterium]|nr:pyridoxal phosphate-dependent aminotransferase [Bryobacterales bacterium]
MGEKLPRFAARAGWNLEKNRLAQLGESRRRAGHTTIDLTESNPTRCGFTYDEQAIREAMADPRALLYEPQPRGLLRAREAVAEYYAARGVAVSPERILLTSGSSEAYGYLLRLLADPGEQVLVPQPGYPLFEFLSRLNDIELADYRLAYHQGWEIDFDSLEAAAGPKTRAVVVVNPNNPAGSLLKPAEREKVADFCARRGLALIADEVFLDFCLPPATGLTGSLAETAGALTFTLNGLSKTAALPQMKLGWIVASGPACAVEEALARLEVITDTYLSVSTPVQWALPRLLGTHGPIQEQILARVAGNLRRLDERLARQTLCGRLEVEAGWSVILRAPSVRTDEEWALLLLGEDGVLVHPGHFFNFAAEGYLVASLLTPEDVFDEGMARLLGRVHEVVLSRPAP